jgi:phosphoribosylaminoimidazole-succinocarboxamide synthase
LPVPIPGKGRVLTELSNFWFKKLGHVIPNHLTGIAPESVVAEADRAQVAGRSMVVKKLKPLLVEAVVRGYLIGSGWNDYQKTGAVCGIKLPEGLQQAQVRDVSIRLYSEAADFAATRGVIIADTKFEFGVDAQNNLVLIDEILTPDSSRFWPANEYRVGISPPSFDKQIIRDWLETTTWNKKPPAPTPPAQVLAKTSDKYREVQRLLTQ